MFDNFIVITIGTIVSVIVAGLGMGLYLAVCGKFHRGPSLITLVTLGWSFLFALSADQVVEGSIQPQRFAERLVLWFLFALHANVAARLAIKRHNVKYHIENDDVTGRYGCDRNGEHID